MITVAARSRFSRDLEANLPTTPLGALQVDAASMQVEHTGTVKSGVNLTASSHSSGSREQHAFSETVRNSKRLDRATTAEDGQLVTKGDSAGRVVHERSTPAGKDGVTESGSKQVANVTAGRGAREVREMDYCVMLNRVLPPDIRALAWAPVTDNFSARFSCTDRTYRQALGNPAVPAVLSGSKCRGGVSQAKRVGFLFNVVSRHHCI